MKETPAHINLKEIHAGLRGFRALCHHLRDVDLSVASDNVTIVPYINNGGSMVSPSTSIIAEKLLILASMQNIRIKARHIAGILNLGADMLSRPLVPV